MKIKILCLLLPWILLGCSKNPTKSPATFKPTPFPQGLRNGDVAVIPYSLDVVQTADTKEMNDISNRAEILLQAKDYDSLDAFARRLRDSKECYDVGAWKVYFVYDGLDLPEEASNTEWTARLAALQDYVDARTNSVTARVALANDLVSYAWKARGTGWADSVTDEGWRLFGERLKEAVKVLNQAKPLKEQCPYWWSVLLLTNLGLGAERSQYDSTFEEATHAWPDYAHYYSRRAWYLMPRWYGTEGEWESDLAKSAERKGGGDGDLLYARVVWCMHQCRIFTNIFTECNLSWPRVDKGFLVMEKQFPKSLAAKSEHAYLAVLARDSTVARKQFDQIHGQMDLTVWHTPAKFATFAWWTYSADHKFPGQ